MIRARFVCLLAAIGTLLPVSNLHGQWTNNAASPLVVGDATSDLPVTVPTSDGGCFVAWQGPVGGNQFNAVHIQRLSAAGVEMWGHNGILAVLGNNSASFVGDFDIGLASDGNLLVVNCTNFSDTNNPTIHQANVQKFSSVDGSKMWGVGGADVAVTTGTLASRPVHVCSTPDGGCIVGYTLTTSAGNGVIRFRRISAAGAVLSAATSPAFANPQILENGGNDSLSLSQMISAGADGSFIALFGWKVNTSQVGLQTQKFTLAGAIAPGWGTSGNPLTLDTRGLTGFNFYLWHMIPDGSGGAIYGWSTFANNGFGSPTDAVLQHILSSGTFKFGTCCDGGTPNTCTVTTAADCGSPNIFTPGGAPLNFVAPNTVDPTKGRYAAAIDYNPADGSYYMGTEQGPTASGVKRSAIVQKFDSSGNRLFGPAGFTVIPESTQNTQATPNWIKVQYTSDGGCLAFGNMGRGFTTINSIVYGAKVTGNGFGQFAWNKIINSDVTTGKGRNALSRVGSTDDAILVHSVGSVLKAARIAGSSGAPGATAVAPSIDVDVPTAITACDGDTIQISVQVSGTAPILYSWQRHYAYNVNVNPDAAWGLNDGDSSYQCVLPADGTTYSGTSTATLTIHNIHANNPTAACPNSDPLLNQYRVVVYNAASDGVQNPPSQTSSWAVITVGAGACCAADGSCTSSCSAATCTGVYQGNGSVCSPSPCGGACCSATSCTVTTQAACADAFQGNGITCAPSPCPGICCDSSSGACSTVPAAYACISGSTFQAFVAACTPQPCPQPGACCNNGTGACTIRVQSACTSGSTFIGAGSTCDNDPCAPTGACCSNIDSNYCFVLTQTTCTAIGSRRWQGASTVCSPTPCPAQAACCNGSTGACTFVAAPGCGSGSTAQGAGTVCDPNPCPQPAACCDVNTGACTVVASVSQCGGQSVAAGSCQPNPCPTPIACCSPSGCSLSLPNFCGNPAPGGATTCSSNPCAVHGTCCRGSTCSTAYASAAACAAAMDTVAPTTVLSRFINATSTCNSPVTTPGTLGNTVVPCCYANYNHNSSIEVQDIFDFLNDWFAGKKNAIVGGDGTSGTLQVQNIFDFLNSWFAGGCN
jgi:hypothetical protein